MSSDSGLDFEELLRRQGTTKVVPHGCHWQEARVLVHVFLVGSFFCESSDWSGVIARQNDRSTSDVPLVLIRAVHKKTKRRVQSSCRRTKKDVSWRKVLNNMFSCDRILDEL